MIDWENNRDGDITMPPSLKTIGSAGYRDQWLKYEVWMHAGEPVVLPTSVACDHCQSKVLREVP